MDTIDFFQTIDSLELFGDVHRVRDQEECDFLFVARAANQVDDLLLIGWIDVGRRFIRQKQLRSVGQRPGDRHTLLLTDRKRLRPVM